MMETQTEVKLHLYSGIPVVSLTGDWSEATGRLLTETIGALTQAGHGEIVLNLRYITRLPLTEADWLDALERLAVSVRRHCGRLDIVGTTEQKAVHLKRQVRSLLRWSFSEEEAICHITGVPRALSGQKLATRLQSG